MLQPRTPLVANVTARPTLDPAAIRALPRPAGHRPGALAREHGMAGRRWGGRPLRRSRGRQGARRHRQAGRPRLAGSFAQRPGGPRGFRRHTRQDLATACSISPRRRQARHFSSSGRGIGAAIARRLHGQGAQVVLSGTRTDALEALVRELGPRAVRAACDLADPAAVAGLVAAAETAAGADLDILVANAGITRDGLLVRMKDADWTDVPGRSTWRAISGWLARSFAA